MVSLSTVTSMSSADHTLPEQVYLIDEIRVESRRLKLPVHIGREDEMTFLFFRPTPEDFETLVRLGRAIEVETVTIEAPGQVWIGVESLGIGHLHEMEAQLSVRWIGLPESFLAPKIRQPGIPRLQ
jgi:hypothetical protein